MSKERNVILRIGEEKSFDTGASFAASIDDVLSWLNEAKSNGATNIEFSASGWDGEVNDVEVQPLLIRKETEQEYKNRIVLEEAEAVKKKVWLYQQEKAQYEMLKKKFEP